MSVKNLLRSYETVLIEENYENNYWSFTGPGVSFISFVKFSRIDSMVVLYISGNYASMITSNSEFISTNQVPDIFVPDSSVIQPTVVLISNGSKNVGCAYIGDDRKIHISGDVNPGSPFTAGSTNAGIPNAITIIYVVDQ